MTRLPAVFIAIALSLIAAAIVACGSHKTYQDPLPDEYIATVKGSRSATGIRIYFTVLDHNGEEKLAYTLEVPTGPQKIVVYFATPDGKTSGTGWPLEFYADGGRTYQVKGSQYDRRVWLWIEDADTHEVVGGQKPS